MKKVNYFIFLISLLLFINVTASDKVNLINDKTYIQQETNATYENGILALTSSEAEYLVNFSVPGLTNTYSWEGDVKITDINETVGYSGVRFCIGYDESSGNYINLILTRNIGVSANQRGSTPVDDVIPLTNETFKKTLTNDMTFHFEIIRDGAHVILKVDNETVIDYTLPNEFNLFTEGDELNLGFYSCMTAFEVSNLAVYDEDAVIPTPTLTPNVTENPTETPIASVKNTATPKLIVEPYIKPVSPLIIAIAVVAVIFSVFTIILIIKNKRKV